MEVADELRPYLQPNRSPRGLDVLSVEKQLGITLYYLKDQGSLMMTANSFGVALCRASVIVHKVCDALVKILGPTYMKLPATEDEMREEVKHMENKHGFLQAFGCVDGRHIPIMQPLKNPTIILATKWNILCTCRVHAIGEGCLWTLMSAGREVSMMEEFLQILE